MLPESVWIIRYQSPHNLCGHITSRKEECAKCGHMPPVQITKTKMVLEILVTVTVAQFRPAEQSLNRGYGVHGSV